MALMRQEITFDGRAPSLARIAEKMTELTGLPVTATESDAGTKGDVFDLHGHLAFAAMPEERVTVWTHRPGTVRQFFQDAAGEVELPAAVNPDAPVEEAETQTVHVEGNASQEPTLFHATLWALESLGGRARETLPAETVLEYQEYRHLLTPDELQERHRQARRQIRKAMLLGCLLMPFLLGIGLLTFLVTLVLMPFRTVRAVRMYRELNRRMREEGPP